MIASSRPVEHRQPTLRLFVTPSPTRHQNDQRLLAAVKARLQNTGYRELGRLDCEVIDGLVVLGGVLPSFYLKQLAQEAIAGLGADGIRNLVSVHWPDSF